MKKTEDFTKLETETIGYLNAELKYGVTDVEKFEAVTKLLNVILCAGQFSYVTTADSTLTETDINVQTETDTNSTIQ